LLAQLLGEGRYCSACKAFSVDDFTGCKPYTIKQPLTESGTRRIESEISYLKKFLQDDNIIQYQDQHSQPKRPFLVQEYVPSTLADLIEERKITFEVVIEYLQQIPTILNILAERSIAHCDIKCANLGYDKGIIKLMDFNLARVIKNNYLFMPADNIPYYNAPEMREGNLVTRTSDVYSAGVVLEGLLENASGNSTKTKPKRKVGLLLLQRLMVEEDYAKRPLGAKLEKLCWAAGRELEELL